MPDSPTAPPAPTTSTGGDYTVRLSSFEGPLDLLLFLIRRAEVEITDIPIAAIADQYLDYLKHIDSIDIDLAGEFLVMAATLTEIKARMLAPPAKPGSESGEASEGSPAGGSSGASVGAVDLLDPRAELIRQLLDYKKFRDAAAALDRHRFEWENRFPAAGGRSAIDRDALAEATAAQNEALLDLEDVTLADLAEAFAKILDTVDLTRMGEHHVTMDDTPIELHAADILEKLRSTSAQPESTPALTSTGLPFHALFASRTRAEMIGLFLAMLELVRQRKIRVTQDRLHGEIVLTLGEEAVLATADTLAAPTSTGAPPRTDVAAS